MNFFRNNEYFNPIGGPGFNLTGELPLFVDKSLWIEGYTLTGFFFRPELVYNATEKISLRAGAHFLKYWGRDGFTEIRPLLSASISLSPSTVLTLGSLSGSQHMMYDPHFNTERQYWKSAEDGLQVRTTRDHFFNDTWIDWENFIIKGDTEREIFTFGESFRFTSPQILNLLSVELPLQLQFKHYGGQISNYPEHVTTFFNLATGLRINLEGNRFGKIGLEYTAFLNSVIPDRDTYTISDGTASWFRLHYDVGKFYFGASYWYANDFYSPNGNGLFASIYVFESDYVISKRKLLTGAAYINVLPEDYMELFFGIDTYYDICGKRMDYAMTLHLNFKDMFSILR